MDWNLPFYLPEWFDRGLTVRKEGSVYVLGLFVRVPPNVTAPVTYTHHVRLQQLNFLTAGRVSVEDRSKRAETVRPQLGVRCEKRRECDSVVSATNDENETS